MKIVKIVDINRLWLKYSESDYDGKQFNVSENERRRFNA